MWLMLLLLLSHLRCCLLFSLSDIQMDIAVPRSTGNEHALEVEECACPQGYKGPSCQVLYTHKHTHTPHKHYSDDTRTTNTVAVPLLPLLVVKLHHFDS